MTEPSNQNGKGQTVADLVAIGRAREAAKRAPELVEVVPGSKKGEGVHVDTGEVMNLRRAAVPPPIEWGDTEKESSVVTLDAEARLDELVLSTLAVLARPEAATYQRGRQLVRIVHEAIRTRGAKNAPVALHVVPFTTATLREHLARLVVFIKVRHKKDGNVSETVVSAPSELLSALLERQEYPGVRVIVGVTEAPMLRADGSVLQGAERFDDDTGLYFRPSAEFPEVAESPTREDAQRAAIALLEVVEDFPFATEPHRSAWLAAALTGFAREAILGPCPFVAIDASTRGTGKSLLATLLSSLVLGREAARYSQPETDDEMRKRITAVVLGGEPMVLIDNIDRPMHFPSLDGLLTSNEWADRELGVSRNIRGEARAVWVGTGNNLAFGGDLARRTLHVRLESQLENPEDRSDFKHPELLSWVVANRPRLVHAALTMLRAFFVAGAPRGGVKAWGSLEAWSKLVAPCIVWVGLDDPMLTRVDLEAQADEGKAALVAILDLFERMGGTHGVSVAAVIKNLYGATHAFEKATEPDWYAEAREVVESVATAKNGKPSPQRLGFFLRRSRKRVVGGRWLEEAGRDRSNVISWVTRGVS